MEILVNYSDSADKVCNQKLCYLTGFRITPPSNDLAETLPRQGKRMTLQEILFPRQV